MVREKVSISKLHKFRFSVFVCFGLLSEMKMKLC